MADLQELFSRLKSPNTSASDNASVATSSIWAQPQSQTQYQPPTVSSPLFSPPIHTPNPHHPSAIMSPNFGSSANTPAPDSKANNLLNLLKFNSTQQNPQSSPLSAMQNIGVAGRSSSMGQAAAPQSSGAQRAASTSASDLLASFQTKAPIASSLRVVAAPSQVEIRPESVASPPMDTQNFLLNLLNRPKQSMPESAPPMQSPAPQVAINSVETLIAGLKDASLDATSAKAEPSRADREPTPARMFGSIDSREHTPFEAPSAAKKNPFTYVNPFEELSASTPPPPAKSAARAATPKVEILKHQRDISSSADNEVVPPQSKSRKLHSTAEPSALASTAAQSAAPTAGTDGSSESKQQSVSEKLMGIGEKVDKQVEKALAQADKAAAVEAASVKEEHVPADKGASAEDLADSWESADAEESLAKSPYAVEVYNFPMKPFVSIEIKGGKQATPVRPEALMDIARLKKDFEQIDRTLVTASPTHIVYAISKDGGFRVIRQDSGKDKKVFGPTQERIFNVQICATNNSQQDTEAILATGINGSVFWTTVTKVEGDAFDDYNLESQGFVLPPVPVQDDNTSGSPVKTRAKMSSRHPNVFAISRGKSIYLVTPEIARQHQYTDKKTRIVDNEKYLQDHCLKIHTGKAGKDFAFSEDDSLLVSLDKNGRIKFWDIREMAELAKDSDAKAKAPFEQKAPLLTLTTSIPMEKATPSSIMFVDKERPCVKGVALRYLIVGLKQNHILQLWDLGLNKPVQEIHFPHEKDSDAICSIAYHPKTGVLALGHPTRNSIYFIHLSAPRYNIQSMDQARYTTMLATQDPTLAKPESTAIMSGIRELSFASKGQLRSLDMLKTPVASGSSDAVLFELYAMHSKGVTSISIKHEDLGWSPDNKVLHPVDAEASGHISVTDIRVTSTATPSEISETAPKPAKATPAPSLSPEKAEMPAPKPVAQQPSPVRELPSTLNGNAKTEKPKKVTLEPPTIAELPATNPAILPPASYALAAQRGITPPHEREASSANAAELSTGIEQPSAFSNGSASLDAATISKSINDAFLKELDVLYRKFDEDKRVQDAAAAAKMDAVLRLVSSTLTDNVEKSLTRIVSSTIQTTVLPSVMEATSVMVDRRLTDVLTKQLTTLIPKEVRGSLPSAIAVAMQDKEIQRAISEQTAAKLTPQIEQQFNAVLRNTIVPNFTNLAMTTTQKAIGDVERRFTEQLQKAEVQRRNDGAKIEQLTDLVLGLSKTVQEMAISQTAFQEQVLKLQRHVGGQERSAAAAPSVEEDVVQSIEDQELQTMTDMMTQGQYEDATIMWLQSQRQGELFDKLFVRINPQYLNRLSPLVALSVSAALTSSFDQHITQRLEWLSSVLSHINLNDTEIREVAPKIMDVLQQRMQGAYMQIAELNPQDQDLRKVAALARQINEIKRVTE